MLNVDGYININKQCYTLRRRATYSYQLRHLHLTSIYVVE